jgi:hypothetical protein
MSKRSAGLLLLLLFFTSGVAAQAAEATTQTIVGAWQVIEVTTPDGVKNSKPQPSLWIFAQKHYSLALVRGAEVRKQNTAEAQLTDAEKVAMFNAFAANSGTYSVSGNILTTVPSVAKNESSMTNGYHLKYEMKFEGADTVALTTKVGLGVNSVWKLQRLE